MGSGIDPALMRRVRAGEYVVDPHAVADAMLRRSADRAAARRLSRVLVAGELDRGAVAPDKPRARPGHN
ncbi:MAG: hypothetical protein QOG41_922 [Thermoleophilaceae bacterium]|jgi:uncharacterized membrane-anchored protein|nr:hypothetical protein [Thermoleophilaceae bacterium]MEA2352015.1 hypothetical protein [Thermoleophilaceae bacterium]MEA2388149.1 hypothetical protein [Thermoleophilaceae bacterium]